MLINNDIFLCNLFDRVTFYRISYIKSSLKNWFFKMNSVFYLAEGICIYRFFFFYTCNWMKIIWDCCCCYGRGRTTCLESSCPSRWDSTMLDCRGDAIPPFGAAVRFWPCCCKPSPNWPIPIGDGTSSLTLAKQTSPSSKLKRNTCMMANFVLNH